MTEISSAAYPQKVDQPTSLTTTTPSLKGPAAFIHGEGSLFMRAGRLLSHTVAGPMLHLKVESNGSLNRTVYTHETSLHQPLKTSDTGLLNVEITFWSPGIFRVRYAEGDLPAGEPSFPDATGRMLVGKPDKATTVQVEEQPEALLVHSGEITLRIAREPFNLSAMDATGTPFWSQCRSDLVTSDIFDMSVARLEGRTACFEAFTLGNQDAVFGLGERFDHLERRGKAVDFWNKDAIGTSNTRTYINVPFFLTTRGYGLFLNSSCQTNWEIGTLEANTLGFAIEDSVMDYFIIHGPAPAEILRRYSTLTGFSPAPPVWSYGLWLSRNSYTSWDVVHEVANGIRARGIPADVLHVDTFWFKEDFNCDLRFDESRFPDPPAHMKALQDQGFRISLWQYNFVPPRHNVNYIEGAAKGYFAQDSAGKPYRLPEGTVGSWIDDAIIDFSNPEAVAWYNAQIKALIEMGAATIKTDFGEGIPEDAVYANIEGKRFHNLYSLVYNAAIAETIRSVTGETIVWARSGTAGSQRYPIHWGGDSQCSWAGLSGTLRAALSMGLSGFPFFSHDIGGFIGRPTPELYIRWAQFGLFSSHARCHGCGNENPREPWSFGEEANRIFTRYTLLRYRLLPYIYDQSRKAALSAKPLVRALVIDYPDDRNTWRLDDQYLFGDSFLIAPVLTPMTDSRVRSLYLPAGTWVDFWTKERISSHGQWIERPVDLDTLPIYVKAGSLIPFAAERQCTHNIIGPVTLLEAYAGADGELAYDDGEKTFRATLRKGKVKIEGLAEKPEIVVL